MKFLIKVIITWFKRNEIPVVIYGADGAPVAYWNIKPKDCYFPYRTDEEFWDRDKLHCYPINLNGEYCGCICFDYNDDVWEIEERFEKPEIYEVLNICKLLEIGCEEDENS